MSEAFANLCRTGWIEVIVGGMFSGKTEELLRLMRRAEHARQPFQLFKPRIDDRYSRDHVASHDRTQMRAVALNGSDEILSRLRPETRLVGIDEGQFFDDGLVDVANQLANRGLRVIVAGLDVDWKGEPFPPMPNLMAVAEVVRKQHAVCVACGGQAARTQRLVPSDAAIFVGGKAEYEARCRSCFDPHTYASYSRVDSQNEFSAGSAN